MFVKKIDYLMGVGKWGQTGWIIAGKRSLKQEQEVVLPHRKARQQRVYQASTIGSRTINR